MAHRLKQQGPQRAAGRVAAAADVQRLRAKAAKENKAKRNALDAELAGECNTC